MTSTLLTLEARTTTGQLPQPMHTQGELELIIDRCLCEHGTPPKRHAHVEVRGGTCTITTEIGADALPHAAIRTLERILTTEHYLDFDPAKRSEHRDRLMFRPLLQRIT